MALIGMYAIAQDDLDAEALLVSDRPLEELPTRAAVLEHYTSSPKVSGPYPLLSMLSHGNYVTSDRGTVPVEVDKDILTMIREINDAELRREAEQRAAERSD